MGKPTGFLEYDREVGRNREPKERLKDYKEFHQRLPLEKQCIQGARCMDCGVPFCQAGVLFSGMVSGCPLHNLIPEWNDLVYRGKWELAYERLNKTNPFPEFTGRVCPAPCEAGCTAGLNGPAITIKENERSIIDNAFENGFVKANTPLKRTGKKVAVIGSGPSGLAVANTLNKCGHKVTVFERSDRPGGLLMYGIPNMKLDKEVILRRVHLMAEEGVKFVNNANVGDNYDAKEILDEFDAVVLATGASQPRDLQAEGRDNVNGIHFAVDFLKANTKSLLDSNHEDNNYISAKDKNVIIIGGGDTGTDCVATSLRHGCKSVVQFEIMGEPSHERTENNPWPEWPKVLKVDYGQEEFIELYGKDPREYLTTVTAVHSDKDGNLESVDTVKVEWKKGDSGRMFPAHVEGSEKNWPAELILLAMGFTGSEDYLKNAFGIESDERSNVKAGNVDFMTNVPKVFATGDARRGQSLVVTAISEGIAAAIAVDKFLRA
ncbi:glutamate synthase subunit beta [Clostridium saccharobutylicum]|uniref:Glutamate synthase [NADPH] small chain n=1 Tax=Clostridium saccharobutylicum TaxID=169679 RepID=A0A1S8MRH1_CLOSA|nr:glutamate synthase subunit beta [Clostridium saccharobutylicum]OOM06762.1 glutamate synthase [NADPH] small chain [Clostridium saccharobutylicum]